MSTYYSSDSTLTQNSFSLSWVFIVVSGQPLHSNKHTGYKKDKWPRIHLVLSSAFKGQVSTPFPCDIFQLIPSVCPDVSLDYCTLIFHHMVIRRSQSPFLYHASANQSVTPCGFPALSNFLLFLQCFSHACPVSSVHQQEKAGFYSTWYDLPIHLTSGVLRQVFLFICLSLMLSQKQLFVKLVYYSID